MAPSSTGLNSAPTLSSSSSSSPSTTTTTTTATITTTNYPGTTPSAPISSSQPTSNYDPYSGSQAAVPGSTLSTPVQQSVVYTTYPVTYSTIFSEPYTAAAGATLVGTTTVVLPATSSGKPQRGKGVSPGTVAGVAIATAIIGAAIAALVVFLLAKKRYNRQVNRRSHHSTRAVINEKYGDHSTPKAVALGSHSTDIDLDRLLPQPYDDNSIKSQVQNLFTQIDGHVESFYIDSNIDTAVSRTSGGHLTDKILLDPATRFFAIKGIICSTVLQSISTDCVPEKSFFPHGFTTLTRQLRVLNLDDQATTLSWSRLRTSTAFLLRSESDSEQTHLDQAVASIVHELDQRLSAVGSPGRDTPRVQDLDAICRSGASLGRVLLSQPAAWSFDWLREDKGASNLHGSKPRLTYFPALFRLTDNKARKLAQPQHVLQAKVMQ